MDPTHVGEGETLNQWQNTAEWKNYRAENVLKSIFKTFPYVVILGGY